MANDGTVKIGTELDQSGLKSGLSGLGSFASKGFGAIGGAAKAMAGVTVGALAAVATGMGAAVVSGVKYNAQMENYTASFATMLGSEEAAVAKVNELKEMGAKTPFEMGDLATATTTLLQYGIAADSSKDILSTLGDISLGNAEKLQGLTAVYGKMSSTGKLTGETLEGMISNGFNPLNVISQQTGESMEELRARMSAGGISADEVAAAFKTATSEGGQFYKGMETASTTFDGLISTLKDNANSLVGEVVKPISDSMTKTLLPQAIGYISKLTDAFASGGIPGLIDAAGGVVGEIISGIAAQAPAIIKMASGFLTTLLSALMDQLPALSTAGMSIITELVNAIVTNLPMLVTIALSLVMTLANGLLAQLPALVECGLDIIVSLIQGLTDALPQLIAMLPTIIQGIVTTLLEHLPEIIQCAIQLLVSLIQGLTAALPQLIAMLPTIITTIIDTLLANLGLIIQCAIQLLVALVQGLAEAIPQLIAYIPTIISSIVTTLIDNLPMIVEAAIQIIVALIAGLIQAIPQLLGMGPKIAAQLGESLRKIDWGKFGKDMIDGLAKGITDGIGKIGDAAKSIGDKIKNFLHFSRPDEGPLRDYEAWMPDMVEGMAGGIKDNAGSLIAQAKALAAQMSQTLQPQLSVAGGPMLAQMQAEALNRTAAAARSAAVTSSVSANGGANADAQYNAIAKALNGAKVEMDGQTVGRLVTPYVDDELGTASKLKARYA